jgi:hypothetical protein
LNNVQNTLWKVDLLEDFAHVFHGTWDSFRRLENESVTTSDGEWEHPEWDHSWEIEWSDTSANTEWGSV